MTKKKMINRGAKDAPSELHQSAEPPTQERINELINSSYAKGKADGKNEIANYVVNFLNQKAAQLFLNHQDDLAKEIRGLGAIIVKALNNE